MLSCLSAVDIRDHGVDFMRETMPFGKGFFPVVSSLKYLFKFGVRNSERISERRFNITPL